MRHYILYLKKCPGVIAPRHFKVGIAALDKARTRLASYQSCVGPIYEESFIHTWIGDSNQIKKAENIFKREYKDKIPSAEAGLSEWICDVSLDELVKFANILRDEWFIKMIDTPPEFQPLTMPLCETLQLWYLNFIDNK